MHDFHKLLDFEGELLNFFFQPPHLLDFLQIFDLHDVIAEAVKQIHFGIFFLPLLLLLLFLLLLFDFELGQKLSLVFGFELVVEITNFFPFLVVDEGVVQIPQVGQVGHQMVLVLWVPAAFLHCKGIPSNIQNLQIFELGLFLGSFSEISEDFLEAFDLVVADGQYVELNAVVQPSEGGDLIIVEGNVCQIDEAVHAFDGFDVVEGEVQPFQVDEVPDVFDFFNDVIIELEFLQPGERVQVLDLPDIFIAAALLKKDKERTLILPKLMLSLGMILFSLR